MDQSIEKEDHKQEDPNQEDPNQEDPNQEDPNQEDPKQEDPKQEDLKQEDPKEEDPKRKRGKRGGRNREKGTEIAITFKKIRLLEEILAVSFCVFIIIYNKFNISCKIHTLGKYNTN